MYSGKNEFKEKFSMSYLPMSFINISKGKMYYRGVCPDGGFCYVYCSMNNTKDMYYNNTQTVEELLNSDNIAVYLNEKCVLMVQ